jgi:hypothetical protein
MAAEHFFGMTNGYMGNPCVILHHPKGSKANYQKPNSCSSYNRSWVFDIKGAHCTSLVE